MGHGRIASAAKQPLWAVTIWDKKFNSVAPGKQKSAIKYHYLLAGDLKEKIVPGGDVKLLTTSETDWWTTEDKVVGLVSEGEIVSIPWGGNPNVQYFKGRFVTADNRIATSSDKGILDNKFLYYFMLSKRNTIGSFYRGAGLKHPEMSKVLDMEIPLPSIEVQRSFARCMDNVAKVIAIRKTQLESLSQLVKSRFVEMFGSVPNSTRMADVCSIITDGTHQSPKFVESGIPFLFVSNIVLNHLTYDAEKFIDEATYEDLIKRTPIEIGDVLLSTVGSYGHPAIVNSSKKFLFQRHIAYLKPRKEIVDSQYLHGAILSAAVQEQIERKVKGIAQKTLNLSEIKTIMLPLPPLALQREFAAFVAKVDKLAFATRRRRDLAQQMYRAKIQEFFG